MHSEKSTTVENGSKEAAKCSPASPSTVDAHAQIGVLQQSSVPVDHRLGSDGALPPARPEFHVNSSNKNSDNNTNAVRNNDRSAILTDAEEVLPTTNCVRRLSSGLASSTTSLSPKDLASLVRTIEPPAGYNAEEEVRTAGRGKHKRQKIGLIIALISIKYVVPLRPISASRADRPPLKLHVRLRNLVVAAILLYLSPFHYHHCLSQCCHGCLHHYQSP